MPQTQRRAMNLTRAVLTGTLAVAVVGTTLALGTRQDDYRFFDPLIDVKAMIDRYYVNEVDDAKLQQAAIDGMLGVLGDPYTVYVPPVEQRDFDKSLMGQYVGIGAEVNKPGENLIIVSPMDGSPAWKAGIMAGDEITAIDGDPTSEMTADDCVDRLMGTPGTPVTVTVDRDGEMLEITIVRNRIQVQAVKGVHREAGDDGAWRFLIDPDDNIAYIRLTQFTPGCAAEIARAIQTARQEAGGELGGLVLDLRWNPGGLLDEAIRIADLFLDEGTIVSTKGRAYPEQKAQAHEAGTLPSFPMAVLINGSSASASEVLSGALVENGRAVTVGERTFGKGSVQSVKSLSGGAGVVKMTEQAYYLPSGRNIHRLDDSASWGVDPTPGFFVPMTNDEVLESWRVRREQEILRGPNVPADPDAEPENWVDREWVLNYLADEQLASGVRAVEQRIASGEWPEAPSDAAALNIDQEMLLAASKQKERLLRELERVDRRITAISTRVEDVDEVEAAMDLWPDDAEIVGGELVVKDASGNTVSTLRITGENIERWLIDAGVEPIEGDEPEDPAHSPADSSAADQGQDENGG
ncbi:MAG: carboxyl-terminal processing protease [Phycisphaerales bacterium]|jgi:carboxyl-terminal processing protease